MASTLTYRRVVKEVPGIYLVQVQLVLPKHQEAEVALGRYRDRGYRCTDYPGGYCGRQTERRCVPIDPLEVQSLLAHEYDEIGNFWVNDTITVKIKDKRLEQYGGGPYQETVFTATMEGMKVEQLPCQLHGRTWEPINFEEISVIDGDVYAPPPPAMHLAQASIRLAEAVKKLQNRNFGYITHAEIDEIVKQFQTDTGEVDFDAAEKVVVIANSQARTAAKLAKRQTAAMNAVQKANKEYAIAEAARNEPLAIRQALDIIQAKV